MKRWMIGGIVLGVGMGLAACADRTSDAPSAPVASVNAPGRLPACDLRSSNQLIAKYFGPADAKTAKDLIDQITAVAAGSLIARDRGFDLIALIAKNAAAGTGGDAASASSLINAVTACMFRDEAELPANFPEDYTVAVTTAAPGGLAVRGGAADDTTPVISRGGYAGVGTQPGGTWTAMLAGNPAPARLVLYGRPGTTANGYDWKVLPRNAAFNPPAIVGVCIDVDAATTAMLHEEHIGLLTFSAAYFLDPATCAPLSARRGLSKWAQQLAQVFLPGPLQATSISKGGIGGSTGGIGSEFAANDVANVNVTFTVQPPATVSVSQVFSIQVRATDPVTGATVGGTQLSILAVNNNGVPKQLLGTLTQTTDNAGIATFGDLAFDPSSTGGFRLVVGGGVLGRPAISVGQTTSNKVNAKPAK